MRRTYTGHAGGIGAVIRKKEAAGVYREQGSLLDALELPGIRERICLAGAGGKTTLLKRLAEEYKDRGIRCAVCTTTHMYAEDDPRFLLEPSAEKMEKILSQEGVVFLGRPDRNGKMKAPESDWMEQILELPFPVLIEADGARRLPMKVPGSHEPVYPSRTTHILYLYGMSALGKRIGDVCFRAEKCAALLGKKTEDPVSERDIAFLAASSQGAGKEVRPDQKMTVVLSQADLPGRQEAAERIGRMIDGEILVCGQMNEKWREK